MLNTILTKMKSFAKDETGASAIEYAVMATLLIIAVIAGVSALGFGGIFGDISSDITAATLTP
jgi:pilus assembly protein Flp/PilA